MSNTIVYHMLLEMAIAFMLEVINYKVDLKFKSLLQIYGRTSRDKKKNWVKGFLFSCLSWIMLFYFFSYNFTVQKNKYTRNFFEISKSLLMKELGKSPEVISWAIIMHLLASLKTENGGFQRQKEDRAYTMWPFFS